MVLAWGHHIVFFLLSWILFVCLISLFCSLCNPPLVEATLVVSAPLLTYTFLLLPLQKQHGWIFLFYFIFREHPSQPKYQCVVLQPRTQQNLQKLYFCEFVTSHEAGQVSAKAPPWHLRGMPGRGESYSSCWPQQEHEMWLHQAVTAVRGNSGLIRNLGAVTASCLPISAWACLGGCSCV